MKKIRGNWLKARREELKKLSGNSSHYSVRALAERVGMSGPGLTHLENTDAMPSLELGFNLARELGRSIDWVLTGEETPAGIPVLGTTSTNTNAALIMNKERWDDCTEFVNFPIIGSGRFYSLRITENIFPGRYLVDDLLILDAEREPVMGDEVALYLPESGEFLIRILGSIREDKIHLNSTDLTQNRSVRSMHEIEFIHPIVGSAKWFTVYKT